MSTRIHCSWDEWNRLMAARPRTGGGCKTPARETAQTCVTTDIDQDVKNWLHHNGVHTEYVPNSK